MGRRLLIILLAAAALLLGSCSTGESNGYERYPALPQPCAEQPARNMGYALGYSGDRWLNVMQPVMVAAATRDGQAGYEVTFAPDGGYVFTLFWSRNQIDLAGSTPQYQEQAMPLGDGRLLYPDRITAESLPDVLRNIQIIEHDYGREIAGATAAAQAFADVAALGGSGPPLRGAGVAAPGAAPIPVARARIAGTQGFKRFTAANFRHNLGALTGGIPKDAHAHHVFPQRFAPDFHRAGINIHDPRYGTWWQAAAHQRNAAAYNDKWTELFLTDPTAEQILQHGRTLASKYGLQIYF